MLILYRERLILILPFDASHADSFTSFMIPVETGTAPDIGDSFVMVAQWRAAVNDFLSEMSPPPKLLRTAAFLQAGAGFRWI